MMRTVLAIIVYLFSAAQLSAQERYFLCIQTEDKQPFYVRMSNKTWSSSSVGNLVVPGLGDSTYQLSVGFPGNKYPEQNFLVTFNRKDLGFTLRPASDQNWTLVSWENGERLSPRAGQPVETTWYGERKKEDAFTHLMAAVVNDSAVLYVASVKELPGKQEVFANITPAPANTTIIKDSTVAVVADSATLAANATGVSGVSVDSALVVQSGTDSLQRAVAANAGQVIVDSAVIITDTAFAVASETKDSTVAATGLTAVKDTAVAVAAGPILVYTAPKPTVKIVKDYILPKGRNMVFIDSSASGVDTISVIIDADPNTIKDPTAEQTVTQPTESAQTRSGSSPTPDSVVKTVTNTAAPANPSTANPVPADTTAVKEEADAEPEKKKMVMINSDCSNFATDNDIDKLRVKILDEPTIDSKLAATKKLFKSKCLYTRQIRALSELFMNDEGKYKFFEQCYPFTADTSEFRSLLSLLSEDAYIARFKTLVRMKD